MNPADKAALRLMWLVLAIFALGCLLRAVFLDFADQDGGVLSDHFVNAITAKNIATGHGWTASAWEFFPLSPHNLTTGPTMILPVSLAIHWFGHGLVVPSVVATLVCLVGLLAFVRLSREYFLQPRLRALVVVALVVLCSLFYPYYWGRVIGEIIAVQLLLSAALVLGWNARQPALAKVLLAAVLAGLACTSKELCVLATVGVAMGMSADALLFRRMAWGRVILQLALFAVVSAIPLLLFDAYQHSFLSQQDPQWIEGYKRFATWIHDYYSGVQTWHEYLRDGLGRLPEVLKRTSFSAGILFYGCWLGAAFFAVWGAIALGAAAGALAVVRRSPLPAFLLCMAMPLIAWFFLFAENAVPRHIYIASALLAMAVLTLLVEIRHGTLRVLAVLVWVALVASSSIHESRVSALSFPHRMSSLSEAMLEVDRLLKADPAHKRATINGVDANEFEYLADQPNALVIVETVLAHALTFDEQAYLEKYPEVAKKVQQGLYRSGFDYFTHPDTTERHAAPVQITGDPSFDRLVGPTKQAWAPSMCSHLLFHNEYYAIEHCDRADIERYLAEHGGLDFRPVIWLRPRLEVPWEMREFF